MTKPKPNIDEYLFGLEEIVQKWGEDGDIDLRSVIHQIRCLRGKRSCDAELNQKKSSRPIAKFSALVETEIICARGKHNPINSAHEGYAVILEELDEFWEQVRKKRINQDHSEMLSELVQVGAMAQRTAEDLKLI